MPNWDFAGFFLSIIRRKDQQSMLAYCVCIFRIIAWIKHSSLPGLNSLKNLHFSCYCIEGKISEAAMRWEGRGILFFLRGFFFILLLLLYYYSPKGSAKLRWAGRGSGDINMINKKRQKESCATPMRIFFPKTRISLYRQSS